MKKIVIDRGGQVRPKVLKNGDRYDSIILLYNQDSRVIHTVPYVNTDYSVSFQGKGGILAEMQALAGVVGRRKSGFPAIWLFQAQYMDRVRSIDDLTDEMVLLKSLIPNPNHGCRLEMSSILLHNGGYESDLSQGCPTIYPEYAAKFFGFFSIGETMNVELVRNTGWVPPEYYQGK